MLTWVGDVASTFCRSGSSKETKDRVLDIIRVVLEEEGIDNVQNVSVAMFLRHLALLGHGMRASSGSADKSEGED
jgi:hypothetical protein